MEIIIGNIKKSNTHGYVLSVKIQDISEVFLADVPLVCFTLVSAKNRKKNFIRFFERHGIKVKEL